MTPKEEKEFDRGETMAKLIGWSFFAIPALLVLWVTLSFPVPVIAVCLAILTIVFLLA
jgi:uncharacterized membrane protein